MPLPFLIAGAIAGAIGLGSHINAKEKNERAQSIARSAERLYNNSKESLEAAQTVTEKALINLGTNKKKILNSSMNLFTQSYEKIKHIELRKTPGLDELSKFNINDTDTLQIRKMSNIYSSAVTSSATGAATGTVIALAASGALPIVSGTLTAAGSALIAGEIGIATGLASSALSFGAAMTPLAAIAAPVVLFSGISANIEADENLEEARTMYAEAEAASEEMKTSEVLCEAISDRSDMFDNLLNDLNDVFSMCVTKLNVVVQKKSGFFGSKKIPTDKLSKEEIELIGVTRSLAGAIKAVIDKPLLSDDGEITSESLDLYNSSTKCLVEVSDVAKRIETNEFGGSQIENYTIEEKKSHLPPPNKALDIIRNLIAIPTVFFFSIMFSDTPLISIFVATTLALIIINHNSYSKFFIFLRKIAITTLSVAFCVLLYSQSQAIIGIDKFILKAIGAIFISFILFAILENDKKSMNKIRNILAYYLLTTSFFIIALLIFGFLHKLLNINFKVSIIIAEILFFPFAYFSVSSLSGEKAT